LTPGFIFVANFIWVNSLSAQVYLLATTFAPERMDCFRGVHTFHAENIAFSVHFLTTCETSTFPLLHSKREWHCWYGCK